MFREDFVWGVASSAYQVEGKDQEDGAGKMIWDTFTEEGGILDHTNAYVSCDHMHRYKDDYKLMRLLGVKAYRFSINWARILPEGTGRVNEKGVALYRDMMLEMKKNGITPYITMYHWELPQALQDRGGWLNEEIIEWFGAYAKVVAERFTDLAQYIFTLNEPQCFVGLGHLSGVHAPGLKLPPKEVFQIAHNALRAHGMAVKQLRKYAKQPIQIGFAPTCGVAYPYTDKPEDVEAARSIYFGFDQPIENWTWNVAWFADPVFLGKYPEEGVEKYREYLPEITDTDLELIHQPIDFMGQNIYTGYYIRRGADGSPEYVDRPAGFPKTAANWPVTPECLYWGPSSCMSAIICRSISRRMECLVMTSFLRMDKFMTATGSNFWTAICHSCKRQAMRGQTSGDISCGHSLIILSGTRDTMNALASSMWILPRRSALQRTQRTGIRK